MPQEIEVRYILPALRKELAKELAKELKQNEVAKILNITPAAVSQYLNQKRGTTKFNKTIKQQIKSSIKKILTKKSMAHEEMYNLANKIRKTTTICDIHRLYDEVPEKCEVCFKK